jgi:hypothetical protein
MIVVSDYGQTTIDFGSASIGQELSHTVIIQNISNKTIQVSLICFMKINMNKFEIVT